MGDLIIPRRPSSDRLARYIPIVQLFAARVVLFHQTVAERLGLTGTEFKCFRLVERLGPMSLATLAREAGLKPGTVSPLVDKLAAAGFLRRDRDATDRRRLDIVAVPEAADRAGALYSDQADIMVEVLADYSERDFALILGFLERTATVLARSQRQLTDDDPARHGGS